MGRTAQGNQATRTRQGEAILGGAIVEADHDLILVTRQGYAKRLNVAELRLGERGNIGTQALRFRPQDQLAALFASANPRGQVGLITSEDRLMWLNLATIEPQDKEAMGNRLPALNPHETIRGAIGSIVY
jgi:DNA gyrase subunit A